MAELNFQKIGKVLCKIDGGNNNNKTVSVSTNDDIKIKSAFENMHLDEGKFQQIPNFNADKDNIREILMVTGPSGSGKSTYICNYLKEYKKQYKNNPIYLFSTLKSDKSLDKMKPQRINISESLLEDPIVLDDLKDSICIFDDIEAIKDKKVRKYVFDLMDEIATTGRHTNTSLINANHIATNNKDTKTMLSESQVIVYFPNAGSVHGINYLLKEYVGIDKDVIKMIKKSKSRWCAIFRQYPQVIMLERDIFTLSSVDND